MLRVARIPTRITSVRRRVRRSVSVWFIRSVSLLYFSCFFLCVCVCCILRGYHSFCSSYRMCAAHEICRGYSGCLAIKRRRHEVGVFPVSVSATFLRCRQGRFASFSPVFFFSFYFPKRTLFAAAYSPPLICGNRTHNLR